MNYALIFAGGVGSRMHTQAMPKQFLEVHGKPIIVHTLNHFQQHPMIDGICVVCVADWLSHLNELIVKYHLDKVNWVCAGGATAAESQYIGLKELVNGGACHTDTVLIHDGVRPLITAELIDDCIESVKQHGSAITVAPAIETIIQTADDGTVRTIIPRDECMLARAPQCFTVGAIMAAHEKAKDEGLTSFIDSASLMLHYGNPLHIVQGSAENIKVTTPADFHICTALLAPATDNELL